MLDPKSLIFLLRLADKHLASPKQTFGDASTNEANVQSTVDIIPV